MLPVGCKTLYTDVYSPRGNRFVPPKEKKIELPEEKKPAAPAPVQATPVPGLLPEGGAVPGLLPDAGMMAPPPALPPPP